MEMFGKKLKRKLLWYTARGGRGEDSGRGRGEGGIEGALCIVGRHVSCAQRWRDLKS